MGAGGIRLGGVTRTTWPTSGLGGSGADNYIPRWNGASDLENSVVYQTDAGNVGIGTRNPDARLHVKGSLHVNGRIRTEDARMDIMGLDALGYSWFMVNGLIEGTNNALGFRAADKQVFIGPGWNLAGSTSDRRLKKDIQDIDIGLNFVKGLKPVSYVRKNQHNDDISYGFIAQEVDESLAGVNNSMIDVDSEGMLRLDYNQLIAPLVRAVQEQQRQIDDLTLEIKALKQNKGERTTTTN